MNRKSFNDLTILLTYLIFVGIAGCGSPQKSYPDPAPGIDPRLQEYVDRFEEYAYQFYGDINFRMPPMDIDLGSTEALKSDTPGHVTVGWCRRGFGKHKIMISEDHWKRYSESSREMLMFHELGHCVLGRGHRDIVTPLDRPVSIMNSVMFSDYFYEQDRDYYIEELFTNLSWMAPMKLSDHDYSDNYTFRCE